MDIANFPSLRGEEFLETCHHLDRRYCQAELGALRMRWKLRLRTVLRPEFVLNDIPNTFVQITRVLEFPDDSDLDLDLDFSSLSLSHEDQALAADQELMDLEESDKASIRKPESNRICGFVSYEIHLHPTYRMPCLWFRIWGLVTGESQHDLDTIFRRLVPDEYKNGLRRYGGVGGISMDHHPVNGDPWFFVHPCLAGDQMSAFECSREDYLTIWLGLVGGCVGLWIPKEMVPRHPS